MPFKFEGAPRIRRADDGIAKLKESSDALIIISNNRLATLLGNKIKVGDAFKEADNVLYLAVSGILDIVDKNGFINRDFNDVRNVLSDAGEVVMGTGTMSGDDRLIKAAEMAINNPLVETTNLTGNMKVLVQMNFPENTLFDEFEDASNYFQEHFGETTEVLFGISYSSDLKEGEVRVTIIAAASKRMTNENDTTEETRSKTYIDIYENREKTRDTVTSIGTHNESSGTRSDYVYKFDANNIDDLEKPAYFRKYRDEFDK